LNLKSATPVNIDAVSGARPSVFNSNGGLDAAVVYVHADAQSDIVYVDGFDVRTLTLAQPNAQPPQQHIYGDAPRIRGDWVVWQGDIAANSTTHHIYSYSISQQTITQ